MATKYTEDEINDLGKKGQAFKNDDGSFSYPVADEEDLKNAIHAVGRGNADHDAIRKYIIGRAKALGLSNLIPDNWNADGSMSDAKSAEVDAEQRADCPTCDGTGTIMDGNRQCPDCNGTGTETKAAEPVEAKPVRKARHRAGLPASREVRLQPGGIEVRRFAAEGLEVRSGAAGSDTIEITGSPIVYNAPYTVNDMFGEFTETMAPGVCTNVLASNPDCRFLFNHDGLPLARTTSGTMTLADTPNACTFTAQLDARQSLANDLAVAIERGDVSQMSCGFIVANDTWNADMTDRTIYRFQDLLDVSAVTYPASPTTSIAVAERMMLAAPVESRARVRRMWAVSKELRSGRQLTPETADVLMDGLEVLAIADDTIEDSLMPEEDRSAPTAQDAVVSKAIIAAHSAVAAALAAQSKDPDNNTDPVDKQVWNSLSAAQDSLTAAMKSQAKDGAPDAQRDAAMGDAEGDGATANAGPDGTMNGPSPAGPGGVADGTGSRSAALKLELDLLRTRKTAAEARAKRLASV